MRPACRKAARTVYQLVDDMNDPSAGPRHSHIGRNKALMVYRYGAGSCWWSGRLCAQIDYHDLNGRCDQRQNVYIPRVATGGLGRFRRPDKALGCHARRTATA